MEPTQASLNNKRRRRIEQLQISLSHIKNTILLEIITFEELSATLQRMCEHVLSQKVQNLALIDKTGVSVCLGPTGHEDIELVSRLSRLDPGLGHANMFVSIIREMAASISAPVQSVLSMLGAILESECLMLWCHGLKQFWSGSAQDGWQLMNRARVTIDRIQKTTDQTVTLATSLTQLSKTGRFITQATNVVAQTSSSVESIQTITREESDKYQTSSMIETIESLFYARFILHKLHPHITATITFYRNLEVFLGSVSAATDVHTDLEVKNASSRRLMQSIIHIHEYALNGITTATIWTVCDTNEITSRQSEGVYSEDDPSREMVSAWMGEHVTAAAVMSNDQSLN